MNRTSLSALVLATLLAPQAWAQSRQPETPAYLNPHLPAEQRAADLVHRMTLEEKTSQMVNAAAAIPRLNIPAYNWWSEALHGSALDGSTVFPEPIGLAATFDSSAIHEMAEAIGTEGRANYASAMRAGSSGLYEGLDFWAPNINIFRDPRWGRGQETYGEDPFLTAEMGIAFVTGMQGNDPNYYRVISTPKHFAVHSGPEPGSGAADNIASKHDLMDTYLPAFRAAVTEGRAGSVMCSYNSLNGVPTCASDFLLKDMLRGQWGFQGYVVSDCDAVSGIFGQHHYTKTAAEGVADAVKAGMDNECGFGSEVYLQAVKQGLLKEQDLDASLTRLYTARMKLGMFDPAGMAPYSKINESELNSAAHHALALKIANESMVLLKNDGVLPLKKKARIAVVGPLANQTKVLLGNYSGIPTHTVSILEGMREEFGDADVQYVPGTTYLSREGTVVPARLLSADGKPGVKASYTKADAMAVMMGFESGQLKPIATSIEPDIDTTTHPLPAEVANEKPLFITWDTTLIPDETGDYNLGMLCSGSFNISVNGKPLVMDFPGGGGEAKFGFVHLESNTPYKLTASCAYYRLGGFFGKKPPANPVAKLVWAKVDLKPGADALAAAKSADVVVVVAGITSELESEENDNLNEDGFKGGDRTSLDLPKPEEDLIEALAATGKPLVVVLTNGSAMGVNWANEHANAILDAWYPGEEGGLAVAQTLSGKNNPAGRLPVTFYKSVDQLPPFKDYSMAGRTYRYFKGAPLYPFGYGRSYTEFSYSKLSVPHASVKAGDTMVVEATVKNEGKAAGDEVAQLYLKFPAIPGAPLKALRGFQRVNLAPGASTKVRFILKPRDMSMVTEAGEIVVAEGNYAVSVGGGQPDTGAPEVTATVHVKGTMSLPE